MVQRAHESFFGVVKSNQSAIADHHGWSPLNWALLTSPELVAKKATICYNNNNKEYVYMQCVWQRTGSTDMAGPQVAPNSETPDKLLTSGNSANNFIARAGISFCCCKL